MALLDAVGRLLVRVPGAYLSALLVGVLVTATVVRLAGASPGDPVLIAAVTMLLTLVVTGVLWLSDPLRPVRSGLLPWFLITLIALWAYKALLNLLRDESLSISALMLPAAVTLIALRTPVGRSARGVATVVGWAVLALSALTLGLESAGWFGVSAEVSSTVSTGEESADYFLPLSGPLNLDGRWGGPFGHPNMAGPVGAYVLIVGLTLTGAARITFVLGGSVILLLTGSRTSLIAALVGLAVLTVVRWTTRPRDASGRLRLLAACAAAAVVTAVVIARNPGLTGRTSMWPQAVELWRSNPWLGVGSTGFRRAIEEGRLPEWAVHAHNVFLDAGARTGIVGLALCLLVVGLAFLMAVSASRRGDGLGLALVSMIVTASLTDAALSWRYLTGGMIVLILAALVSSRAPTDSPSPVLPSARARGSGPDPDREPSAAID